MATEDDGPDITGRTVKALLHAYGRDEIDYPTLRERYAALDFRGTGYRPIEGGWGRVFAESEERPEDRDVPETLHGQHFARVLTDEQHKELLAIWRARVDADA